MNILILGSGGREHALAMKISQSRLCDHLDVLPGNSGMADLADLHPEISLDDFDTIVDLVCRKGINYTIVGPEQPLVEGIVDRFHEEGLAIFGPTQAAAMLEGSKVFAKSFMKRHGIPTAGFRIFSAYADAEAYLDELVIPPVIKASGLAAGKGVLLPDTMDEARMQLRDIMVTHTFGDAGNEVVIEERMNGPEISVFALIRHDRYWILPTSRDHKRAYDGDRGPNTGGMGALAPVPGAELLMERIDREIVEPTVAGLRKEETPYEGILYFGLMLTDDGPKVIEYNCRFGDPEAQVVLAILDEDLLEAMVMPETDFVKRVISADRYAVGVVVASGGYPGGYLRDLPINGLEQVPKEMVVHSGTRRLGDSILTHGGRVLTVVGQGSTLTEARVNAYHHVGKIKFKQMQIRNDIGLSTLQAQMRQENRSK